MKRWPLVASLFAIVFAAAALAPLGPSFDLSWHTFAGGGGTSTGGGFELSSTIGQSDAGLMTGGTFELRGGFWTAAAPLPCPADLDGDGQVTSGDLTLLLGAWAAGTADGDIDNDGDTDSIDLTLLLGAWAGGGCP